MIKRTYDEELEEAGMCLVTFKGTSMLPLLRQNKDCVVIVPAKEPKKHDILLYRRPNGTYIMHRILAVKEEGYVLCGDHQWVKEYPVKRDWCIGVADGIYRGDRFIQMDDRGYRLYVEAWCRLFFLRRIVLRTISLWRAVWRRLRSR